MPYSLNLVFKGPVIWTAKRLATGLDCSCSYVLVGCNKELVAELVATGLSVNQFSSKVGLVKTFKICLKMLKMIKI